MASGFSRWPFLFILAFDQLNPEKQSLGEHCALPGKSRPWQII